MGKRKRVERVKPEKCERCGGVTGGIEDRAWETEEGAGFTGGFLCLPCWGEMLNCYWNWDEWKDPLGEWFVDFVYSIRDSGRAGGGAQRHPPARPMGGT